MCSLHIVHEVAIFWVVISHSDVGILSHHYMVSQLRRLHLESSLSWKPQVLQSTWS